MRSTFSPNLTGYYKISKIVSKFFSAKCHVNAVFFSTTCRFDQSCRRKFNFSNLKKLSELTGNNFMVYQL